MTSREEAKQPLTTREELVSTPGPWSVYDNPNSNYGLEVVANVKIKAKRVVCRIGGPDREANARLIAAAPAMFDYIAKKAAEGDREARALLAEYSITKRKG
jgi:hypothetical protein